MTALHSEFRPMLTRAGYPSECEDQENVASIGAPSLLTVEDVGTPQDRKIMTRSGLDWILRHLVASEGGDEEAEPQRLSACPQPDKYVRSGDS